MKAQRRKIMGAGYSHSAFIDKKGKLYVWGDNSRQTLQ